MARLSKSNFPPVESRSRNGLAAGLLVCLLLSACAGGHEHRPAGEARTENAGDVADYLLALREYLAEPPGAQASARERLHAAAARGGLIAQLEYAFALSVDRDDRASLERARDDFENLLAAPDPLPVALDALVRLQLGQVRDRLQRMHASGEIHSAYRAAATGQKVCLANLDDTTMKLDTMRAELAEVRRKLDALARIEQTVNGNPETRNNPPPIDDDDNRGKSEEENENNAERPPDTAGR